MSLVVAGEEKVEEAVFLKKTLMVVNTFVVQTTQFVNHFAALADDKLASVSERLGHVEQALDILESRFARIPELQNVKAAAAGAAPAAAATSAAAAAPAAAAAAAPATAAPATDTPPAEAAAAAPAAPPIPEPEPEPDTSKIKVSEHPAYKAHFKRLRIGVPQFKVEEAMERDGLDTSLLETPDALIDAPADEEGGSEAPPPPPVAAAAPPPPPLAAAPAPAPAAPAPTATVADDPPPPPAAAPAAPAPEYAPFFRMLKMGVPMEGVRNKIIMSGLDPSVLDAIVPVDD